MLRELINIYYVLEKDQKIFFYKSVFLSIIQSILEVFLILVFVQFMALVSGGSALGYVGEVINDVDAKYEAWSRVEILGYGLLVLVIFSMLLGSITAKYLSMLSYEIGLRMSFRLYRGYLMKTWNDFTENNRSEMIKNINSEVIRVSGGIILPAVMTMAKLILGVGVFSALLYINWVLTIFFVVIVVGSYYVIFNLTSMTLSKNSKTISELLSLRQNELDERFSGFHDISLTKKYSIFLDKFLKSGEKLSKAYGQNAALSLMPRYIVEGLVLFAIVLYMILVSKDDSTYATNVLPTLAGFAIGALKLLPALQQGYSGLSQIKGNMAAWNAICDQLKNEKNEIKPENGLMSFSIGIELANIVVSYPRSSKPALNRVSIKIPKGTMTGIVGRSGSGKSTLLRVLLNFLEPSCGYYYLDNKELNIKFNNDLSNIIGYVPQHVILYTGSLAENVAFGLKRTDVDENKVKKALILAGLDDLAESLDSGIWSWLGSGGVSLSGGQIQRIGIARALYFDPPLMIFDEATSSLDTITTRKIRQTINELRHHKTIVIVDHSMSAVEMADHIYVLSQGEIVSEGNYQTLLNQSHDFQELKKD